MPRKPKHERKSPGDRVTSFIQSGFEKTELLPDHELQPQIFRYETPDIGERHKAFTRLCLTDIMLGGVQIIEAGGENTLHNHAAQDGFYYVLKGRLRFYGEGDVVLCELGPHEGIAVPRGYKYWHAAVGDEPVELLQVIAFDRSRPNKHKNFGAPAKKENTSEIRIFDAETPRSV